MRPVKHSVPKLVLLLFLVGCLLANAGASLPLAERINGASHIIVASLKPHHSMSRRVRRRAIEPLFCVKGTIPKDRTICITYKCDTFIPGLVGTASLSRTNTVWILFLHQDVQSPPTADCFELLGVGEHMYSDDTFLEYSEENLRLIRASLRSTNQNVRISQQ